jgi:hypothetical protein
MITLATTQTTISACIQIQNLLTPDSVVVARRGYSAGRSTSSSVRARILTSRPSVQCSM